MLAAGRREDGRTDGMQNQKQEPHTKMWGKIDILFDIYSWMDADIFLIFLISYLPGPYSNISGVHSDIISMLSAIPGILTLDLVFRASWVSLVGQFD